MEYTFLVFLALFIDFLLDVFIFKTKLLWNKKFYLFISIVTILQFIVDNYLNGRWWLDSYIVGPYDPNQYSGIIIWHTPLENFLFGWGLIWMNLIVFEWLRSKSQKE
jgi:hypothetical protein